MTLNLRIRYDISHVQPSYIQERQIRPGEVRGITVSSLARGEKFIVSLHEGVSYGLEVMWWWKGIVSWVHISIRLLICCFAGRFAYWIGSPDSQCQKPRWSGV